MSNIVVSGGHSGTITVGSQYSGTITVGSQYSGTIAVGDYEAPDTNVVNLDPLDASAVLADLTVEAGNADVALDPLDSSAVLTNIIVESSADVALDPLDASAVLADLTVEAGNADVALDPLDSSAVLADLAVEAGNADVALDPLDASAVLADLTVEAGNADVVLDPLDSSAVLADLTVEQEESGEYHPPITTNIRFDFTYSVNTLYSSGTTVSNDTDPVATIVDESASSNDATQPTTARKPTNDDTNDEIDFDGTDDFMLIPGLVGLSENSTHYIVHRTNTMQDDDYIFGFTADGFVNTELRLALNDASPDNYRAVARSTTTLNDAFGGIFDTDLHLFTVLLDGANMVVRMDGSQIITVAYPGDFNPANIAYYVLGARYRGETAGLGNAIAGSYKGLYIYQGIHDSSDLAANEASIMTQHGIS